MEFNWVIKFDSFSILTHIIFQSTTKVLHKTTTLPLTPKTGKKNKKGDTTYLNTQKKKKKNSKVSPGVKNL